MLDGVLNSLALEEETANYDVVLGAPIDEESCISAKHCAPLLHVLPLPHHTIHNQPSCSSLRSRQVVCGTQKTGPVLMILSSCHSGSSIGKPHLAGKICGKGRHPSGATSLEQCLNHRSQWSKTCRPHRQHFLRSLLLLEKYSVMNSLGLTQPTFSDMGRSQPQFARFPFKSSVTPLDVNHTSIRQWIATTAEFPHTNTDHSHPSSQLKCWRGTLMSTIPAHSHYKWQLHTSFSVHPKNLCVITALAALDHSGWSFSPFWKCHGCGLSFPTPCHPSS